MKDVTRHTHTELIIEISVYFFVTLVLVGDVLLAREKKQHLKHKQQHNMRDQEHINYQISHCNIQC